jgi:hypothetical protein
MAALRCDVTAKVKPCPIVHMFPSSGPSVNTVAGAVLAASANDDGRFIALLVRHGPRLHVEVRSADGVELGEAIVADYSTNGGTSLDVFSPKHASTGSLSRHFKILWSPLAATIVVWRSVEAKLQFLDVEAGDSLAAFFPSAPWVPEPSSQSYNYLHALHLRPVRAPAFPASDAQFVANVEAVGLLVATSDRLLVLTSWHGVPLRTFVYDSPLGLDLGWIRDMHVSSEWHVAVCHFSNGSLCALGLPRLTVLKPADDKRRISSDSTGTKHEAASSGAPEPPSQLKRPSSLRWMPGMKTSHILSSVSTQSSVSRSLSRTASFAIDSAGRKPHTTAKVVVLHNVVPPSVQVSCASFCARLGILAVGCTDSAIRLLQWDTRLFPEAGAKERHYVPHTTTRLRGELSLQPWKAACDEIALAAGSVSGIVWAVLPCDILVASYGSGCVMAWSVSGSRLFVLPPQQGLVDVMWLRRCHQLALVSSLPQEPGEPYGILTSFPFIRSCASNLQQASVTADASATWFISEDRISCFRPCGGRTCIANAHFSTDVVYDTATCDTAPNDCDLLEFRWFGLDVHPEYCGEQGPVRLASPSDGLQLAVASDHGIAAYLGKNEKWRASLQVRCGQAIGVFVDA